MGWISAQGLRAQRSWVAGLLMATFLIMRTHAHVGLDAPNESQTLSGGSELAILWHVERAHATLDWDLWYSGESDQGPWIEIATDLPAGDISDGAAHLFHWTLPNIDLPTTWVRVRQDNENQDYFDVSDASFRIEAVLRGGDFTGDGNVNAADLAIWQQGFGQRSGAALASGDADLDGDVDGSDLLRWQRDYRATVEASVAARAVPEPASIWLLLLGMASMLWKRHSCATSVRLFFT